MPTRFQPSAVSSDLPLVIAAGLSIAAHLWLVPQGIDWLTSTSHPNRPEDPSLAAAHRPLLDPPLKAGADVNDVSTVAWISHDDFRKLIAPKSETEQPAVQQEVDPVVESPLRREANPAPSASSQTPTPQPRPTPVPAVHNEAVKESTPGPDDPSPPQPIANVETALAQPPRPAVTPPLDTVTPVSSSPARAIEPATSPISAPVAPESVDHVLDSPPTPPTPAADSPAVPTPSTQPQAKPDLSAAPTRSDKDSDPAQLSGDPLDVQLGSVITGRGIEIKPARPVLSVATQLSALPKNASARITFDPDGAVIEVELTASTGYPDVDGPLVASMYKWKASGPLLEELGRPFILPVRIIGYE